MGFATYTFLFLFLPLALLIHGLTPARHRLLSSVILSIIFYSWWRIDFCLILLFLVGLAHFIGQKIHRTSHDSQRKWLLWTGLFLCLAFLGWFKYSGVCLPILNSLPGMAGIKDSPWVASLLPLGISFYVFHLMSYLLDIHRKQSRPGTLLQCAAYVLFFPKLVAGPIMRHSAMAPALEKPPAVNRENLQKGILWFMIGFSKKVLLADSLGRLNDFLFEKTHHGFWESWLGLYSYAIQLYFDFSGYSDMAIGLGWMFGFSLMQNFDAPYRSRSITDFWRRWHISLSQWFRDYVFYSINLALARRNPDAGKTWNSNIAVLLSFTLIGIWHGTGWTFVLFGLYHGLLLAWENSHKGRPLLSFGFQALEAPATFLLILLGWGLFRSPDLTGFLDLGRGLLGIQGMGDLSALAPLLRPSVVVVLLASIGLIWFFPTSTRICEKITPPVALLFSALFILSVLKMIFTSYTPFLYFQF